MNWPAKQRLVILNNSLAEVPLETEKNKAGNRNAERACYWVSGLIRNADRGGTRIQETTTRTSILELGLVCLGTESECFGPLWPSHVFGRHVHRRTALDAKHGRGPRMHEPRG
jgi:hypothetical protein